MSRTALVAGIGVCLAGVITLTIACAAPAPQTSPVTGTSPPAPAPSTAQPAASETKPLVIALGQVGGSESLDPKYSPTQNKVHLNLLYDYAVGMTDDGSISDATGLARNWETSQDYKKWTVRLRKGVTFHSGESATSADVKFGIERQTEPGSLSARAAYLKDTVASIETPDDETIVFQLKKGDVFFLYQALSALESLDGMVVPKAYIKERGDGYFGQRPIGTGPYKFDKQVPGDFLRLVAVSNHWRDGKPKFATVEFRAVPEETTRLALLQNGQADIVDVSRENAPEAKGRGFRVFVKDGGQTVAMFLHQQWKDVPIAKKEVREALNLAIDRKLIVDKLFNGVGQPYSLFPLSPWGLGYQHVKSLPPYSFDPARAKQLLSQAGYPSGFKLAIYSYPFSGVPEAKRTVETVAGMWSQIGIEANIIPISYDALRGMWKADPKVAGAASGLVAAGSRLLHLGQMQALTHSKGSLTLVTDPNMDKLMDEVSRAPSEAAWGEAMGQAQRYIYDNYLYIPLLVTGDTYAANQRISEWKMGNAAYEPNFLYLTRSRRGP